MKYILGSLITCFALSAGNLFSQEIVTAQEIVGPITINVSASAKDKLDAELTSFKEYWTKSQKDLSDTLTTNKMTIEIFIDANAKEQNKVSEIIKPYKASDADIQWKQLCIDKEKNTYIIQRYASKAKSGLNKNAESSKKISIKFQCVDDRKEKALDQTFAHAADTLGSCLKNDDH